MRINSFRYNIQRILLLILAIVIFASANIFEVDAFSIGKNDDRLVYVGGFPIGLAIKTDGVMVEAVVGIETCAGRVTPKLALRNGDIIQKINESKVLYASDIIAELDRVDERIPCVTVGVRRGHANINIVVSPLKEELSGKYKLGLAVKEGVAGVGTVSFIKKDGSYGALGHPICDGENSNIVPCFSGSVYGCKIVGYAKGQKGRAGELKGVFVGEATGSIVNNCKSGIYGKFTTAPKDGKLVSVAPHGSVKAGKAQIISTIDAYPELFDIEIIRAIGQNSPDDKGMVLRVTDRRLLSETGGIVQGMSGSPILQNGKLVGAVTHVFLNDPTKGYGIYSDFMYDA